MRYLSVCSGIEAASVAWSHLGWEPAGFAEIEKFPSMVLRHHYPDTQNFGDMNEFRKWNIGAINLLVGGTPCQAFSTAGKRKGLADERGNLTLTFCQLADHFNPEWIVWENVPGVLTSKDNAFGCFLGELCGTGGPLLPIGGGGDKWANAGLVSGPKRTIAWRVLDAQFFGVAQRRRRVFVVASRGARNWGCAKALFSVGEGLFWNSPPSRKMRENSSGRLENGFDERDWPARIAPTIDTQFGDKMGFSNQHIKQGCPLFVPSVPSEKKFLWNASDQPNAERCLDHAGTLNCDRGQRGGFICPTDIKDHKRDKKDALAFPANLSGTQHASAENLAPSLGAKNPTAVAFQSSQSGVRLSGVHATLDANNGSRRHNGVIVEPGPSAIAFTAAEARRTGTIQGSKIAPTLTSQTKRGDTEPCVAYRPSVAPWTLCECCEDYWCNIHGVHAYDCNCPPLEEWETDPYGRQEEGPNVAGEMVIRRLTPLECERLQGFPDGYTDIRPNGKPTPDNPRYKALGNSMAVPVMRWIGERIANHADR